jgi:hypothetical protein
MADDELYESLIAEMELWARRAEYWRNLALWFANGDYEPYPLPGKGAERLREMTPRNMDWNASTNHPVSKHWW